MRALWGTEAAEPQLIPTKLPVTEPELGGSSYPQWFANKGGTVRLGGIHGHKWKSSQNEDPVFWSPLAGPPVGKTKKKRRPVLEDGEWIKVARERFGMCPEDPCAKSFDSTQLCWEVVETVWPRGRSNRCPVWGRVERRKTKGDRGVGWSLLGIWLKPGSNRESSIPAQRVLYVCRHRHRISLIERYFKIKMWNWWKTMNKVVVHVNLTLAFCLSQKCPRNLTNKTIDFQLQSRHHFLEPS